MTQCPRCGKDNPADIHTCTPLALRLLVAGYIAAIMLCIAALAVWGHA